MTASIPVPITISMRDSWWPGNQSSRDDGDCVKRSNHWLLTVCFCFLCPVPFSSFGCKSPCCTLVSLSKAHQALERSFLSEVLAIFYYFLLFSLMSLVSCTQVIPYIGLWSKYHCWRVMFLIMLTKMLDECNSLSQVGNVNFWTSVAEGTSK